MNLSLQLIIYGAGVLLVLGFIYLFRWQLATYALNRGIGMVQKLALQVVLMVSDSDEIPHWVLIKESSGRYSLGLLTKEGPIASTIFLPTGPRLIPGQLNFIKNEQWRHLEIDFEEGLELIISMGLTPAAEQISKKIWNRMEEF